MKATDVAVVGGGAVGIAIAYYLSSAQVDCTVIDSGDFGNACSFGNSGIIAVSHPVPLASRSSVADGMRWLFDRTGPFSIRPQASWHFATWMASFLRECVREAPASAAALSNLARQSADYHAQLAENFGNAYGYRRTGWLHAYSTENALARALKALERSPDHQNVSVLDREELVTAEPKLTQHVVGGIYYRDDAHLQPMLFVRSLAERSRILGAHLFPGVEALDFRRNRDRVTAIVTSEGELPCGHVVIAAGAWTATLLRKLRSYLPIQPGRGHSATFQSEALPAVPLMLGEPRVTVTPQGQAVRVTSGLELVGFNTRLNRARWSKMLLVPQAYLTGWAPTNPAAWMGFRPMTPDDLPVIDFIPRWSNVLVASGHGTLGITLAPATAAIIKDLVIGGRPNPDSSPFRASRFDRRRP